MTIVVFVGPTLSREDIAACGDMVCLPPVAQGDVYRAAQRRPQAIRNHRRILLRRPVGLAQGDLVGDVARHSRLRRREYGRAARC